MVVVVVVVVAVATAVPVIYKTMLFSTSDLQAVGSSKDLRCYSGICIEG